MSLQTVEEVADVLGLAQAITSDLALKARLQRIADIATKLIERYCHRSFTPVTDKEVFYNAPYSHLLPVPDVTSITSLTAFQTPLVLDTDYRIILDAMGLGGHHLQRIDAEGFPILWTVNKPNEMPADMAIDIVADFGWDPPADEAILACEMVSANMWNKRKRQWAGESGGPVIGREVNRPENGFMTREVRDLLKPFRLEESFQLTPSQDIELEGVL